MNERELFIAAIQIDEPQQREAYLNQACESDPQLLSRIHALIEAFETAGSFLDAQESDSSLPETQDSPGTFQIHEQIGPYKLLEQIGEGGMGVVWMAEQQEPVRRRVALKLIKPGMDSRQILGRFEAERQALSLMEHPNVAKVLDAGTSDNGNPFFVMELVKGQPITAYCDQHHLTPGERLGCSCPCAMHPACSSKGIITEISSLRTCWWPNTMAAGGQGDRFRSPSCHQPLTERTVFTGLGKLSARWST